jgi:hypothetical protein
MSNQQPVVPIVEIPLPVIAAGSLVLANSPGSLKEEGGFSPSRAECQLAPEQQNEADSPSDLQISECANLRQILQFGEKPSHDEDRERIAAVIVRASAVDDVLVNVGGRPTVLNETAKLKLCVLLKLGYTRSMAAAQLGINRSTVAKAIKNDAAFKRQVLQAEELFESVPLLTLIEAAQKDWRAAIWLMKNHQPHTAIQRRKRRRRSRQSAQELQDEIDDRQEARERSQQREKEREWAKARAMYDEEKKERAERRRRAAERKLQKEKQAAESQRPAG